MIKKINKLVHSYDIKISSTLKLHILTLNKDLWITNTTKTAYANKWKSVIVRATLIIKRKKIMRKERYEVLKITKCIEVIIKTQATMTLRSASQYYRVCLIDKQQMLEM